MIRILPSILGLAVVALINSSCFSAKNEDGLDGAMQSHDVWLEKQVKKSERRGASFDEKWDNYTKNQDDKYHSWLNKVMED